MALPPVSTPQFPTVADLPGVPQLSRSPIAAVAFDLALATPALQSVLWQATVTEPQWGIFDKDGNLAITPDSVLSFDNRNEWAVSSFPVQAGAFANYNKVASPFECAVRLSKGKTIGDRATFLAQLDTIAKSLEVYTIRTPERSYNSVNVTRYEVSRRDQNGAFFLTEVDVYFIEIREVAQQYTDSSTDTTNAIQPEARTATNQGGVSPQDVTLQQGEAGSAALLVNSE